MPLFKVSFYSSINYRLSFLSKFNRVDPKNNKVYIPTIEYLKGLSYTTSSFLVSMMCWKIHNIFQKKDNGHVLVNMGKSCEHLVNPN